MRLHKFGNPFAEKYVKLMPVKYGKKSRRFLRHASQLLLHIKALSRYAIRWAIFL